MKSVVNTHSNLAKFMVAASFFAIGCTAVGGQALAAEPLAAAPAEHSTANWSVTYPVRYSDLDISTMQGAKTLYLRIRFAAETLCESAATWGKKEGEACVNKAVDDAIAHLNLPLLSQYHQLRIKGDKVLVQLANAN